MTDERIGHDSSRKATATLENLRKVFTIPESEGSTLARIEQEISKNLDGFLRQHIVAGDLTPAVLESDFTDVSIPEDPMFVSDQTEFLLHKVVSQSVHTASPRFVGHMTSALPYFMLPLAKIMMALNQNTVKIETSKAFTPLESQVIAMMHRLIYGRDQEFYRKWTHDRDQALGVFSSGGTVANLTALWVARNQLLSPRGEFRGVADDGVFAAMRAHEFNDLAIVVSRRGHYSLRKSADVLGLGRRGLVTIQTTAANKIDVKLLRAELKRMKQERIGVVAIVGVAGTTETGHVDPLDEMADVAAEFGVYFHVDAAWGGPTLFSERYRPLLKGIERADSVIIDAHKQLYVPVGAGITLFKKESSLAAIEQSANYIIRKGSRDLGKHTLEGTRSGMAMLVHSGLKVLGRKGYELLIDLGIGKAGQFAKVIQATSDFELMTEPELNLLTYRWCPERYRPLLNGNIDVRKQCNQAISELTALIQKIQRGRGHTFVSRTSFDMPQYDYQECTVFRVVLANPLTTRQILAEILEEQRAIGTQLFEAKIEEQERQEAAGIVARFESLLKQNP